MPYCEKILFSAILFKLLLSAKPLALIRWVVLMYMTAETTGWGWEGFQNATFIATSISSYPYKIVPLHWLAWMEGNLLFSQRLTNCCSWSTGQMQYPKNGSALKASEFFPGKRRANVHLLCSNLVGLEKIIQPLAIALGMSRTPWGPALAVTRFLPAFIPLAHGLFQRQGLCWPPMPLSGSSYLLIAHRVTVT